MNREKRACQPHLFCTVLPQPSHTCSLYLVHSIEDGLVELFPCVGSKGVISAIRVAQQEEMSEGNGVLFPERHHQLIAEPKENELPRRSQRLALIVQLSKAQVEKEKENPRDVPWGETRPYWHCGEGGCWGVLGYNLLFSQR